MAKPEEIIPHSPEGGQSEVTALARIGLNLLELEAILSDSSIPDNIRVKMAPLITRIEDDVALISQNGIPPLVEDVRSEEISTEPQVTVLPEFVSSSLEKQKSLEEQTIEIAEKTRKIGVWGKLNYGNLGVYRDGNIIYRNHHYVEHSFIGESDRGWGTNTDLQDEVDKTKKIGAIQELVHDRRQFLKENSGKDFEDSFLISYVADTTDPSFVNVNLSVPVSAPNYDHRSIHSANVMCQLTRDNFEKLEQIVSTDPSQIEIFLDYLFKDGETPLGKLPSSQNESLTLVNRRFYKDICFIDLIDFLPPEAVSRKIYGIKLIQKPQAVKIINLPPAPEQPSIHLEPTQAVQSPEPKSAPKLDSKFAAELTQLEEAHTLPDWFSKMLANCRGDIGRVIAAYQEHLDKASDSGNTEDVRMLNHAIKISKKAAELGLVPPKVEEPKHYFLADIEAGDFSSDFRDFVIEALNYPGGLNKFIENLQQNSRNPEQQDQLAAILLLREKYNNKDPETLTFMNPIFQSRKSTK